MGLGTRYDVVKSSRIKTNKSWIILPQGKAGTETLKMEDQYEGVGWLGLCT